jgi:hypothetical protein
MKPSTANLAPPRANTQPRRANTEPPTTPSVSHAAASAHGVESDKSRDLAWEALSSIKHGALASEFNPQLFDTVHSLAYAPDDKYSTLYGKMSMGYILAYLRGKDQVAPAQKRSGWAAAPASITLRAFSPDQISNVESHGASFAGVPIMGTTYGKTVFRPAANIQSDLKALASKVKKELRNKDRMSTDAKWNLAAEFLQTFIAIHPYMDGNGRVSRLITDRLLEEMGLPKPKWGNHIYKLDMSVEEAAQQLKRDAAG